jgi:pantothenate kinase
VTQHASLTRERWAGFGREQQVLMIGNEMNRARGLLEAEDAERLRRAYERVLRLVDLTVETRPRAAFLRELLRWREVVAELYLRGRGDPRAHAGAFRALLRLTPASARQVALLLG